MDTADPKTRRLILFGGAAAAVAAGLVIAILLMHKRGPTPPMDPIQRAGLQVEMSKNGQTGAAGDKALRCFVNGQFVGVTSLGDCAKKNGVATDALDVGLDKSGEVTAAQTGSAVVVQPLPQPADASPPTAPTAPVAAAQPIQAAATGRCMRFGADWRVVGENMSLNQCVQTLFAGRCGEQNHTSYGRWGEQTLRLVPGAVERSYDNRVFNILVQQPADCRLPSVTE